MRVLAVIVGVILLLPGACSLGFMALMFRDSSAGGLAPLWSVSLLVSAGGVAMIIWAVRSSPPRDPPA